MKIVLTNGEVLTAATIGIRRHVQALVRGRSQAFGCKVEESWQCNIVGALGEMVVAKALDRYWNGDVGPLGRSDVGPYQVRTTPHVDGHLIVTDKDRDDDVFILVTGIEPAFVIRGWLYGRDAKRPEFIEDRGRGKRFFVPQAALRSFASLPEIGSSALADIA